MDKKIIFAEKPLNIPVMTQMILNIENPDIIPSLRKVLGQLKGVSVAKTSRKKTAESEKETISDKEIASLLDSVKR